MKITITLTNSETGETLTVQEATAARDGDNIETLQARIDDALHAGKGFTVAPKP